MWVVKLGGSLFKGPFLRGWLDALAARGGGTIVIAPGGGPFADQVRAAQKIWHFDDATGHRMAMLGMAQYGLMLAGLQPGLIPATEAGEISRALRDRKLPVWIPNPAAPIHLPRNWSVTSDSLAAWLAIRLEAPRLLLIKSVQLTEDKLTASELARRGIVDETFPELLARSRIACYLYAAHQHSLLRPALTGEAAGTEVTA